LGDKGALRGQLDNLLGRHLLTKNKAGDLVPLANDQRVMRHNPILPVLTAEQEAELFAPVDAGRVLRPSEMEHPVADAKPKSDIDRQLDKIKINNSNIHNKKSKPLDMKAGGLVRKSN
jgi:hypothetical protein